MKQETEKSASSNPVSLQSGSNSVSLQAKALFAKKKAFAIKLNKNHSALKQLQASKTTITDWL